ncbi:MAG TPA: GlsB/YeaQ/YmgE family stress response membrane protein [Gemmatimonadaceae bacterium]
MPLWLHWILLGLIAGALAKFLVPGRDPAGCIITIVLGIAGALLGGWIGSLVGWGQISQTRFDSRSIALATLGAILVLLAGRVLFRYRR